VTLPLIGKCRPFWLASAAAQQAPGRPGNTRDETSMGGPLTEEELVAFKRDGFHAA
jgi:hypothetical protein